MAYQSMPCPLGTFFDYNSRKCVNEGDSSVVSGPKNVICNEGYCSYHGRCQQVDNDFVCTCHEGYSGQFCEINIDDCAFNGTMACAGGKCIDQINGYYCSCPNGIGLDCQNVISPCTVENLSNGKNYFYFPTPAGDSYIHCTGIESYVLRRCSFGLFWNQVEQACNKRRPKVLTGACLSSPCKNSVKCINIDDSNYECVCKNGYTGVNCDQKENFCLSNPCKNGGVCEAHVDGYVCLCPDKIVDNCCCNG
jgi:Notch 1